MTTKDALRTDLLARRQALSQPASKFKSHAIGQRLCAHAAFKEARTLALYAATQGEVDPRAIYEEAYARGKVAAYPRVEGNRLVFYEVEDTDDLEPGAFGIHEPPADYDGDVIAPEAFDVVLVPGIAFDPLGYRLGFGHGYYDKFLPQVRADALRVGLAFACQIVPTLPHAAHDIPMHRVITEEADYDAAATGSDT